MPSGPLNSPDDRTTVLVCLYCGKQLDIARKALSVTCKFCHKNLKLDDVQISKYEARRSVETCGVVTIEKKGQAIMDRILCGGAIVRGKMKGNITSRGPVLVGPDAEIKGNVTAPTLAVGPGAVLEGRYEIGPPKDQPSTSDETPKAT